MNFWSNLGKHGAIARFCSRFPKQTAFVKSRLSPEGYLGLNLTIGAFLLIGATWVFGAIAEDVVTGEPLTIWDIRFSAWLHLHAVRPLTTVLLFVTNLHSTLGVALITIALSLFLIRRRHRYWLLALLLSVFGGMLLNVLLKNAFHRARPQFADPILTLTSYGFPSGHTMAATTLYGVLCAFLVSKIDRWPTRLLTISGLTFLVLLVGFSRIYLGVHYLSDVLGAMAEGMAWLALCLTAVDTMQRRQRQRQK
jgi:undecaprenyl-diphosphatase